MRSSESLMNRRKSLDRNDYDALPFNERKRIIIEQSDAIDAYEWFHDDMHDAMNAVTEQDFMRSVWNNIGNLYYDHDEIPSWLTMNDLRMLLTLNITDIDPFFPSKIIMMQRAGRTDFNEFKYSRIDDYSNDKLAYVICDSIASDYDMTLHALNALNTLDVFNRCAMIKLAYKANMLTGQANNIIAFMQNPIDFTRHDWNPCLNMHMDNVLWNDLSINFIDELTAGHVNMARARNWMLCLYDEYVKRCFDRHYDYMWTTRSMDTLTELFNDMYPYHELPVETQIEAFIGYINDYLHD